jgi:hypothetical protein
MVAALNNDQRVTFHPINEAMFAVDAAGPMAGKIASQGFWLSRAFKRMPLAFHDQAIELAKHGTVVFDPMLVLIPAFPVKLQPHSSS